MPPPLARGRKRPRVAVDDPEEAPSPEASPGAEDNGSLSSEQDVVHLALREAEKEDVEMTSA